MKPSNVMHTYHLTPPFGASFDAVITKDMEVFTNRRGPWGPDQLFTVADLFMPELDFNEWEIHET